MNSVGENRGISLTESRSKKNCGEKNVGKRNFEKENLVENWVQSHEKKQN